MKIVIFPSILVLIQLLLTLKPSLASDAKSKGVEKITEVYQKGLRPIDENCIEQYKNLSEHILKDSKIQEASTPLIKEFKQNITKFLNLYSLFEQYYLHSELIIFINEKLVHYATDESTTDDNDFLYIMELLKKHDLNDIIENYEEDFVEFTNKTLLAAFEDFASELPRKERDLRLKIMLWLQDLKECQDYNCYLDTYAELQNIFNTLNGKLFQSIYEKFDKINMEYATKINKMLKSLLKDSKLTNVEANLKENFTNDCHDFLKKYKSNRDIANLDFILQFLNENIIQKYYNNNTQDFEEKEKNLLKDILLDYGLEKLVSNYQQTFKDFIENYLNQVFDNYKTSLDEKDLQKDNALLQWYDKIKQLKTHEERIEEFNKVYDLDEGLFNF